MKNIVFEMDGRKFTRTPNGKLWVFSEQVCGWIPLTSDNERNRNMEKKVLEYLIKSLIEDKRVKNPGLSPGMAFQEVLDESPELISQIDSEAQASLDRELRASFLSKLVDLKLKKNEYLSYSEAFSAVQRENPELTLLYQKDIGKR